jgi:predicted nucleic acid-binding protein
VLTLDANVIIAITDETDACHDLARDVIDSYEWEGFTTTTLTLAEVLVRPVRRDRFEDRHRQIEELGVGLIGIDGAVVRQIAELCAAHRLRAPDAAVLAVAMSATDALITFDKRLARTTRRLGFPVIDAPAEDLPDLLAPADRPAW